MVVTDTHALLWYITGDKQLGKSAKEQFQLAEKGEIQLIIPVIVLFETLIITEKKRLTLKWRDFLEKVFLFPNHLIYPIDTEVLFETQKASKYLELHDRIIVATAKINHAPLLTKDPEIKQYGEISIVWN